MSAGFRVINNAGSVLIDENYKNLVMVAKGTVVKDSTLIQKIPLVYYPDGLLKPIIALRVTGGYVGLLQSRKISPASEFSIVGDTGATVEWFHFDIPAPVSTAGIKIFDSIGKVVFDSGLKYARVVDVFQYANATEWENVTKIYPDGRKIAVAFLSQWWRKNAESQTEGCAGGQLRYRLFYEAQMCGVSSGQNNTTFMRKTYRQNAQYDPCTFNDPRNLINKSALATLDVEGY